MQGEGVKMLRTKIGEYPYYFAWGNNSKRATMKGRRCAVICRGKLNSCMIEFEDGQREVVSRNSIRKVVCDGSLAQR